MGGADRRPAAQQNIKPDAQVNECDQPQPIVHGALGRDQHHFHVERNRAPDERIGRLRPDAGVVETVGHRCRSIDGSSVDADHLVVAADTGALGRSIRLQPIRHQVAVPLHPPGAIVGNRGLVLNFVVETGEQNCGYCEEGQQDGGKPSLKFAVHGLGRLHGGAARYSSPFRYKQLHCHPPIPFSACKSRP